MEDQALVIQLKQENLAMAVVYFWVQLSEGSRTKLIKQLPCAESDSITISSWSNTKWKVLQNKINGLLIRLRSSGIWKDQFWPIRLWHPYSMHITTLGSVVLQTLFRRVTCQNFQNMFLSFRWITGELCQEGKNVLEWNKTRKRKTTIRRKKNSAE